MKMRLILATAIVGLALAPSTARAVQVDTVTATGSGAGFDDINIRAESTPTGQNPDGAAAFTVAEIGQTISGPVTCLSVTGPDRGAGSALLPTTAVLNFENTDPSSSRIFPGISTVEIVDRGGSGLDFMSGAPTGRAPTDCSLPVSGAPAGDLDNGRAVVFDAPLAPSAMAECKDGGWRAFPQFKNQGQCIAFVNHSP
jgi:hypothetical protein